MQTLTVQNPLPEDVEQVTCNPRPRGAGRSDGSASPSGFDVLDALSGG